MKALITLVVVQTAILLALFMRVILLEGDIAALQTPEADTVYVQPSTAAAPASVTVTGIPDENRLREIIREELEWQLADLRAATADSAAAPSRPYDSGPQYEDRRDSVSQSIDYYVSVGRITEAEMAQLQLQIAETLLAVPQSCRIDS